MSMEPDPSPSPSTAPYEEGFLGLLLLLAVGGLGWLLWPFLPGLVLAALMGASTFPLYVRLRIRMRWRAATGAAVMTLAMVALVVTPLLYLLASTAVRMARAGEALRRHVAALREQGNLEVTLRHWIDALPLPEAARDLATDQVLAHKAELGESLARGVLFLFQGISGNSLAFLSALALIVFALFFFYRDGPAMVARFKRLTPLAGCYDDVILSRFQSIATVLILSTGGIALAQGISFAVVTAFMGLPWFYLGVGVAVASFIPVVGGMVIWGPLCWFLLARGESGGAMFILFWGAVVNGFLVDNLLRPYLIQRLSGWFSSNNAGGDLGVLQHTLMTVLATLGGVMAFGILGLFFGPLMAAMAITIFDVYEIKHGHVLDRCR